MVINQVADQAKRVIERGIVVGRGNVAGHTNEADHENGADHENEVDHENEADHENEVVQGTEVSRRDIVLVLGVETGGDGGNREIEEVVLETKNVVLALRRNEKVRL